MANDKDLTQAEIDEILALIGGAEDLPEAETDAVLTEAEANENPTEAAQEVPVEAADAVLTETEANEDSTEAEVSADPTPKKKIAVFLKKHIFTILMVVFAAIFLFFAGLLVDYFINSNKQKKQHNELASIVEQIQQQQQNYNPNGDFTGDPNASVSDKLNNPLVNNNNPYVEVPHPVTGELIDVLREYSTVYLMNTDLVGWIKIGGTKINYPVLQSPDHVNYYLKRDFYKEDSRHGSIFAHEMANFSNLSDNITLYGHNMGDGSMFADLHNYRDPDYYDSHAYITFDTLTNHNTYKIFAVFDTTDLLDSGFAYHDFVDGDEEEFNAFVTSCKELSLYDTGETPVYGNKLLTLSTCDNDVIDPHGRFVVVARKVSQ